MCYRCGYVNVGKDFKEKVCVVFNVMTAERESSPRAIMHESVPDKAIKEGSNRG